MLSQLTQKNFVSRSVMSIFRSSFGTAKLPQITGACIQKLAMQSVHQSSTLVTESSGSNGDDILIRGDGNNSISHDETVLMTLLRKTFSQAGPGYRLDYESLCKLFINFAEVRRRPAPILKAASQELCQIPPSQDNADALKPELIITTLKALVSLSYPNYSLISKLISDLTSVINLDEVDSKNKCSLLRSVGSLRWRDDKLLTMFFEHLKNQRHNLKLVDHRVLLSLLHVAALLNYRYDDIKQVHDTCMKGVREDELIENPKRWLDYVWSLVALGVDDGKYIKSVLNQKFYRNLEINSKNLKVDYPDVMKLLNLKALAQYEFKIDGLNLQIDISNFKVERSVDMKKYAFKLNEALNGIDEFSGQSRSEIQTPYGFMIDREVLVNLKTSTILPMPELDSIKTVVWSGNPKIEPTKQEIHRCALIYILYDDTIINASNQVVGRKKMIARILRHLGYDTIYLPETLLSRGPTSTDLTDRIKTLILSSIENNKRFD